MSDIEGQPTPVVEQTADHRRAWGVMAALGLAGALVIGGVVPEADPAAAETTTVTAACGDGGTVEVTGALFNDWGVTMESTAIQLPNEALGAVIGDIPHNSTGNATIDLGTTSTPGGVANFTFQVEGDGGYQLTDSWGPLECEDETTTTTEVTTTTEATTTTTEQETTTTTEQETTTTTEPTTTTTEPGSTTTTIETGTTTTTEPGSTTTTEPTGPTTTTPQPPKPPVVEPPVAPPAVPVPAPAPAPQQGGGFEFGHTA